MIDVRSISKCYGKVLALQDVSFSVEQGDCYGIIGLSGAGKSTLIRCLARLVTPSSGTILFQGRELSSLSREELRHFRRKIGMIFQHFNLLSARTVEENVVFPLEITGVVDRKRVQELLEWVGLSHKKDLYPAQLSGGEKQRVGIARALITHPALLLCDEATSALDPKTTREILHLLKHLHKKLGFTIVLITHEMEVVKQICTKVAVLEHGRIVEEGLVTRVFSYPHHPTTQQFLQSASHETPEHFFKPSSPSRRNVRLRFMGAVAQEPVISEISRRYNVNANILSGWIDHLQTTTIGTLVVELTGDPNQIEHTFHYLQAKGVHYDEC